MKTFILACLMGISTLIPTNEAQKAHSLLANMHETLMDLQEHSYRLNLKERKLDKSFQEGQMLIRVKDKPLRIQAEVLGKNKGPLVEYNAAENLYEATIIPKQWLPAVKIKGDIHGSILRKGHYAINETSLAYFDRIIQGTETHFRRMGSYEESVQYMGTHFIQNRSCHKIALKDHQYHIKWYRVKAGENLIDIGKKLLIHPFKIRELNPHIDSYYELEAGQNIRIPSSYGKTCIIYLDEKEFLPRRLEVYDENGMFEQYSFHDIHLKK